MSGCGGRSSANGSVSLNHSSRFTISSGSTGHAGRTAGKVGRLACWKSPGMARRTVGPRWMPAECSVRPCHLPTSSTAIV